MDSHRPISCPVSTLVCGVRARLTPIQTRPIRPSTKQARQRKLSFLTVGTGPSFTTMTVPRRRRRALQVLMSIMFCKTRRTTSMPRLFAGLGSPYGYTFSDLLAVGGVTPAPSIWTGSQEAKSIEINIFAIATTPTASSNPPSGFNTSPTGYLPPTSTPPNNWHYQSADFFVGTEQGNTLQVDTRLGGKYHPDSNYPMTFRVYPPTSAKAGSDGFVTYDLASPNEGSNPWASWVINSDYTITNAGTSGLNGFLWRTTSPRLRETLLGIST